MGVEAHKAACEGGMARGGGACGRCGVYGREDFFSTH